MLIELKRKFFPLVLLIWTVIALFFFTATQVLAESPNQVPAPTATPMPKPLIYATAAPSFIIPTPLAIDSLQTKPIVEGAPLVASNTELSGGLEGSVAQLVIAISGLLLLALAWVGWGFLRRAKSKRPALAFNYAGQYQAQVPAYPQGNSAYQAPINYQTQPDAPAAASNSQPFAPAANFYNSYQEPYKIQQPASVAPPIQNIAASDSITCPNCGK